MIKEYIKKSALKLNIIDKVHLAESLLESLGKTDEQIEQAWAAELDKRYKAFKEIFFCPLYF